MANIQKRGSRCLPRQQHMWDEGRPLSFCQPHPLPRQHSIDTLRPQIEQNSCQDPHPACAAGVAHACTRAQFHGDPRVNLVSISHPETSNQAEFMPRPSSCMCCWRGARVHACTQFHGEPRVNLVAQHPIPQSARVGWPSSRMCCWRGARVCKSADPYPSCACLS